MHRDAQLAKNMRFPSEGERTALYERWREYCKKVSNRMLADTAIWNRAPSGKLLDSQNLFATLVLLSVKVSEPFFEAYPSERLSYSCMMRAREA